MKRNTTVIKSRFWQDNTHSCNGCGKLFKRLEDAYYFPPTGEKWCVDCKVEILKRGYTL